MEMAKTLHEKLNYTTHEVKALHLHMIYAHQFEEILIGLGQSSEMTDIILMAMGEAQLARLNLALHELADHQLQKTQKMETSTQAYGMVMSKGKEKLTTRMELNNIWIESLNWYSIWVY